MAKKNLEQCRTAKDFIKYAERQGGVVEGSKKGVKVYGPNDGFAVIHSNHPRDLATGTRAALIKALVAIGLGVVLCGLASLVQMIP